MENKTKKIITALELNSAIHFAKEVSDSRFKIVLDNYKGFVHFPTVKDEKLFHNIENDFDINFKLKKWGTFFQESESFTVNNLCFVIEFSNENQQVNPNLSNILNELKFWLRKLEYTFEVTALKKYTFENTAKKDNFFVLELNDENLIQKATTI